MALEGRARMSRGTDSSAAIQWYEEALALACTLGIRGREAALRNTLGILEWERGAFDDALRHYEAALALVRELEDGVHEGLALNSIGVTLARLRRYEEARTVLEDALVVNRRTGGGRLECHTLAALGDVALETGRYGAALKSFEESLEMRRGTNDRRGEGWMLHRLWRTRTLMGDTDSAALLLREAARIAGECGDADLARACGASDTETSSSVLAQQE
jgi:tetratricopeptide (TPR) repeat protein